MTPIFYITEADPKKSHTRQGIYGLTEKSPMTKMHFMFSFLSARYVLFPAVGAAWTACASTFRAAAVRGALREAAADMTQGQEQRAPDANA